MQLIELLISVAFQLLAESTQWCIMGIPGTSSCDYHGKNNYLS